MPESSLLSPTVSNSFWCCRIDALELQEHTWQWQHTLTRVKGTVNTLAHVQVSSMSLYAIYFPSDSPSPQQPPPPITVDFIFVFSFSLFAGLPLETLQCYQCIGIDNIEHIADTAFAAQSRMSTARCCRRQCVGLHWWRRAQNSTITINVAAMCGLCRATRYWRTGWQSIQTTDIRPFAFGCWPLGQ